MKPGTLSKKPSPLTLALALAAALALPSGALALNYSGSQKNQATFETLDEARTNGPVAVVSLEGNRGRTFKSHPVLDSYPKGTPLSTGRRTCLAGVPRPGSIPIFWYSRKSLSQTRTPRSSISGIWV